MNSTPARRELDEHRPLRLVRIPLRNLEVTETTRQGPRGHRATVGVKKVNEVVDRWSERCGEDGFSRADALELLGELRQLVEPAADVPDSASTDVAA